MLNIMLKLKNNRLTFNIDKNDFLESSDVK